MANMMSNISTFRGAVLKEQGVTFAVVRVEQEVLGRLVEELEELRASFSELFQGLPVILMARDWNGRASYNGRRDIARFLSTVRSGAFEWIDFRVS